jgi:hypothetical protein
MRLLCLYGLDSDACCAGLHTCNHSLMLASMIRLEATHCPWCLVPLNKRTLPLLAVFIVVNHAMIELATRNEIPHKVAHVSWKQSIRRRIIQTREAPHSPGNRSSHRGNIVQDSVGLRGCWAAVLAALWQRDSCISSTRGVHLWRCVA